MLWPRPFSVWMLLLLASCSTGASSTPPAATPSDRLPQPLAPAVEGEVRPRYQSEDPVTLDWNLGGEPGSLDPALGIDKASLDVTANLFVGLTRYDPNTSAALPQLAISWDVSADGRIYTFFLRNDIQWVRYNPVFQTVESQGPVTAYDVEYSIRRAINPKTGSGYAYALFDIKNAGPIHRAILNGAEETILKDVGVMALDETTVQFILERPARYFPAILAMWVAKPVPQRLVEANPENWTDVDTIWTNGPYLINSWEPEPGVPIRFEKNPFWVAAGQVQIEVVQAYMVVEPSTEFELFKSKELDASGVPVLDLRKVREDPFLSQYYAQQPVPCTYYYGFNMVKAPFDDVRVRTAFSAAIDRERLIYVELDDGKEIPATTFAPPATFGAPAPGTAGLGYDPELAWTSLQEYLTEQGLESTAEFASKYNIVLAHNTGELHARVAEAVQEMLLENLGVSVQVKDQDWTDLLEATTSTAPLEESYHIFRMGWCADYPDEDNWLRAVFHFQEGSNRVRRQCAEPNCSVLVGPSQFDELVEQAARETNPDLRASLYAPAEDILAGQEVAAAFLFQHAANTVTWSWLHRDYPYMGGANWYEWTLDWEIKKVNRP